MQDSVVRLCVPAEARYARSVRMMASSLAVVSGMGIDDVEDVRMAAEEGFVYNCVTGVNDLTSDKYCTAHGGYDATYADQDADRVLPVDVMRDLEKEGVFKKLHNKFYTTVGNGTAVASAKRFGAEIVNKNELNQFKYAKIWRVSKKNNDEFVVDVDHLPPLPCWMLS